MFAQFCPKKTKPLADFYYILPELLLQVTFITVVPPIMVFLAKHPSVEHYDQVTIPRAYHMTRSVFSMDVFICLIKYGCFVDMAIR